MYNSLAPPPVGFNRFVPVHLTRAKTSVDLNVNLTRDNFLLGFVLVDPEIFTRPALRRH